MDSILSDGIVTLEGMMDYADENVRQATNSAQHPNKSGLFDRNLPIAVIK